MKTILTILASTLMLCNAAFAHGYKVADLVIGHPIVRETPVNAPVSGGYMTIENMGTQADRLIAAFVTFAEKTEIHEMKMEGEVMKMLELVGGLEIPAGEKVTLQPGSYHIMFMQLNTVLKEGEKYKATLTFEKAGSVEVELNVETLEKIRERMGASVDAHMDHSGHKDMEKTN